jgi:hypothetical protein
MNTPFHLPRRTFLRGLGTLMALPYLESVAGPASAPAVAGAAGVGPGGAPMRMAFVYVPNGADMERWTPSGTGREFQLTPTLEPLAEVRNDILVLSGLAQDKARANGDGAGDHARASATFLTSMQARKTQGNDIKVGISVDQVAAHRLGSITPFGSIELGTDKSQLSGNCDSGYSCAYSYNIAWRTENSPMPPEVDPKLAFDRLFSRGNPGETVDARMRREAQRKSIIDFVRDDANRLRGRLGRTDQRKLDEYLAAVRDLERRIEMSEKIVALAPEDSRPIGAPQSYREHVKLMFDVMTLAFRTDTSRIATFVMAHDGANKPYTEIGVREGHHDLSHHENKQEKKDKIAKINRMHMELFAAWLKQLKATSDGEGSLLDNCMIVYGSGIADGNGHEHHNLPVILAGRGGGSFSTGRHVRYAKDTPMANLFLSMLDRMGVPAERFGDSTGRLAQLTA